MPTSTPVAADPSAILKGALISGAINAVINGAIQAWLLWDRETIALSVDAISTAEHTVLGEAVPLAVSLAMILTAIAHLTLKGPKRPFLPTGLWLVIKHGLFAFGALVAAAVVWQRVAGTVEVSVTAAVVILGIIAGVVSVLVNYLTIQAVMDTSR